MARQQHLSQRNRQPDGHEQGSEYLGAKFDHSSKKDVYFSKILLPSSAPRWMQDRAALWNSVEKHEVRADAQLGREVLLTLPRGRDVHWGCIAVEDFAKIHFVANGMVCDRAVHMPLASDQKAQPHAHLLLSLRRVTPSEWAEKKEREWNRKQMLVNIRKAWADYLNWLLKPWTKRAGVFDQRLHFRAPQPR